MNPGITREDITLTAADGRALAATLCLPSQSNGMAVQINSASLVPRRYYMAFSEFLAECGFTVLAYDYRCVVADPRRLRGDRSGVLEWGTHDQPAATAWLRARFPALRLALVAHSVGGQMLGLSPLAAEVRAILMVGTAHGYWRRWPWHRRLGFLFNNHVSLPLQLAFTGYAPHGMGPGLALSATAARELARFQNHPMFFCDAAGNALRPHNDEIRVPLRHITLSDDEVVPPGTEIDLSMFYPHAAACADPKTPADFGVERVGHFGFFRRAMPRAAWEDAADWLARNA